MSRQNNRQKPRGSDRRPEGNERNPNSQQRRSRNRMNEYVVNNFGEDTWAYRAEQPGNYDPYVKKRQDPILPPRKDPSKNTEPRNEPLYELPDMITLVPDQRYNLVNLDYCGYLTLCEESYRHLTSVDSRLTRQLTLGTYIHVMNEYFWVRIFKLAELFGVEIPFEAERLQSMVNSREAYLPSEINEYLKGIGQFKDGFGDLWRPNIPDILLPLPRRNNTEGGHFGIPDMRSHNIYEIAAAPYTTAQRVRCEIGQNEQLEPLPLGVAPLGLRPTENFVGYTNRINRAHPDAIARIQNAHFYQDPIGSRIMHSPDLQNVVNNVLETLEAKVKITRGIPENIEGSSSIIGFVTTEIEDPGCILRRAEVTINSRSQLTRSEIGQVNLFNYRRQRNIETPGYCYLGEGDAIPELWNLYINENFRAEEPFAVRNGIFDEILNERAFGLPGANNRPTILLDWIRDNFKKKI